MYYSRLLNTGGTTPNVIETLSIDPVIGQKVSKTVTNNQDGNQTITTSYAYNGYRFVVEVKADAVQEHNAEDAIWSAWGIGTNINNGVLSLENEYWHYWCKTCVGYKRKKSIKIVCPKCETETNAEKCENCRICSNRRRYIITWRLWNMW